jgi:hypothetical protein
MGVQKMILQKGTWFRDPQDWGMELCAVSCVLSWSASYGQGIKEARLWRFSQLHEQGKQNLFLIGFSNCLGFKP